MSVRLRVLVDQMVGKDGLLGEAGWSVLLETPRGCLILDAGMGRVLEHNLRFLGVDPAKPDVAVLSHGHNDHAGGFGLLYEMGFRGPLWMHAQAGGPHFAVARGGDPVFVGADLNLAHRDLRTLDREPVEVLPRVWILPVPLEDRDPRWIPSAPNLVRPAPGGGFEPDPLEDDLSLVVQGEEGWSVILGCAHAGVVNVLAAAKERFSVDRFHTVVGGMHLHRGSREWLGELADHLVSRFPVQRWRPGHCSGFQAALALSSRFDDVDWAAAGHRYDL